MWPKYKHKEFGGVVEANLIRSVQWSEDQVKVNFYGEEIPLIMTRSQAKQIEPSPGQYLLTNGVQPTKSADAMWFLSKYEHVPKIDQSE